MLRKITMFDSIAGRIACLFKAYKNFKATPHKDEAVEKITKKW